MELTERNYNLLKHSGAGLRRCLETRHCYVIILDNVKASVRNRASVSRIPHNQQDYHIIRVTIFSLVTTAAEYTQSCCFVCHSKHRLSWNPWLWDVCKYIIVLAIKPDEPIFAPHRSTSCYRWANTGALPSIQRSTTCQGRQWPRMWPLRWTCAAQHNTTKVK